MELDDHKGPFQPKPFCDSTILPSFLPPIHPYNHLTIHPSNHPTIHPLNHPFNHPLAFWGCLDTDHAQTSRWDPPGDPSGLHEAGGVTSPLPDWGVASGAAPGPSRVRVTVACSRLIVFLSTPTQGGALEARGATWHLCGALGQLMHSR